MKPFGYIQIWHRQVTIAMFTSRSGRALDDSAARVQVMDGIHQPRDRLDQRFFFFPLSFRGAVKRSGTASPETITTAGLMDSGLSAFRCA